MRKTFCLFAFLPIFASTAISHLDQKIESGNSGTVIEQKINIKTEGQSEAQVKTQVNGQSIEVQVNQPGEVEIRNKDQQTQVEITGNLTPTIILQNNKEIPEIQEEKNFSQEEEGENLSFSQVLSQTFLKFELVFKKIFSGFFKLFSNHLTKKGICYINISTAQS